MDYATILQAVINAIDAKANQNLAACKKRNLGLRAEELVMVEADQAKACLRAKTFDYDTALPATPATIRRPEHVNQVVRLSGHFAGMENPAQVDIPRQDAELKDLIGERSNETASPTVSTQRSLITITGDDRADVTTEYFFDRMLVKCLQDHGDRFANWEFLVLVSLSPDVGNVNQDDQQNGAAVAMTRSYCFFLIDARPLETAIQVVKPMPGEIEAGLVRYGNDPNILETATNLVISYLRVVCADSLPIITEAIRFQILAAATEGERAHTLVVGPPGIGKSLIHKAAQLVQPIFYHAIPTKVTEAGLVGDGHSNAKNRRPGVIPMSHTGAFSVEDFNQANSNKNQRFMAVFTNTMAEGKISDTSAAKIEYKAESSIVLDANRKSDVRRLETDKDGLDRFVSDTGVPVNILSRTTYLAEIPRDAATMVQVSTQIIGQHNALDEMQRKVLQEQVRQLQVYLALMRQNHKEVTIPNELLDRLRNEVVAICNTTANRFEQHPELADFMARLGRQALMLVKAHARMCNRSVAELRDVEVIFPFIWRKIDFVKTLLFGGQMETPVVDANRNARRTLIALHLKSTHTKTYTAKQVQKRLGLYSASLATIDQDLRDILGAPDEEGRFQVVTKEAVHA